MKITVVGAGYVGLSTGAVLAYLNHEVTLLDLNLAKIQSLEEGRVPFFEPCLNDLMGLVKGRLRFTHSYAEAIPDADVVINAVGTPSHADGKADLTFLNSAARQIGENLGAGFTVVINKSTAPIGSGNWVDVLIRNAFESRNGSKPNGCFAVASNPEFLRQGAALHDSLYPFRVVVGCDDSKAMEILYNLYKPILEQTFRPPRFLPRPEGLGAVPFISTDLASAELIKYAANAFLSVKVSFINEIGELAERIGADITQIAKGIGLDPRIGTRFLQAGIGWGGSCFGKDTQALIATGGEYEIPMPLVRAAREVNTRQRKHVLDKLLTELKILKGRTVGLLGLAFKPNTDDLRDAPAVDIARQLMERGVRVKAHDPIALDRAGRELSDLGIEYCRLPEEVFIESDAIVLVTEWPHYRELLWEQLAASMRNPLVLDGRNFLDKERLIGGGFKYIGFGR